MRVSIVIPCYNVENYIDDALASALGQRHEDIEVICVDNNSTDKTREYLQGYVERGEIKLLDQAKKGAPAARNMGLQESSGDWIQFLDADDMLLPEKISHQLKLIADNPNAAFVASLTRKTDLVTSESNLWPVNENAWHGLMQNQLGITTANLFSAKALKAIGGWDESIRSSQEYDLMFRIMQDGGEVIIDNDGALSIIQSRPTGSISSRDKAGNKYRFLHLVSRIALYLKKENPEIYSSLGSEYFQNAYRRIVLNAIEGQKDSAYFFRSILPLEFLAEDSDLTPAWFKTIEKHFGFSSAAALMRIKKTIKP